VTNVTKKIHSLNQHHCPNYHSYKNLLLSQMFRRRDIEEIEAKKLIDGATGAMQKLLLVLPVRHEHWFDQLIHALKSNNYQLIVDDIHQNGT